MAARKGISRSALEKLIHADLEAAMGQEILVPYKFEFRASRLPFCPREMVIDKLSRDVPLRGETYGFRFYVGIGTSVHETIQQFLGITGILYGHWTCCGYTELFREGSRSCPLCGRPQLYHEFTIDSTLGGHVDGVSLKYDAVFEFKTTGGTNLEKLKNPYDHHMAQASCYLSALNEEHGWGLNKLIFVYLSRDKPADFKVMVRHPLELAYEEVLEEYGKAKEAMEKRRLPQGVCSSSSAGSWRGCPYAGICFSPNIEESLGL